MQTLAVLIEPRLLVHKPASNALVEFPIGAGGIECDVRAGMSSCTWQIARATSSLLLKNFPP